MGRKLALIGLALLVVGGAGLYALWQRATALPKWYEEAQARDASRPGPAPGDAGGWEVVEVEDPAAEAEAPSDAGAPRPRGRRRVLRNPHLRAVGRDPALREAVRASRATYEDGRLEAGVVLDGGRLRGAKLSPAARRLYQRVARAFPSLVGRKIYVGLEDRPRTRGGYLQLGRQTRIRVGELTYSLGSLARKLGVSPRRVRADINRMLRELRVTAPDEAVLAEGEGPGPRAPRREAG